MVVPGNAADLEPDVSGTSQRQLFASALLTLAAVLLLAAGVYAGAPTSAQRGVNPFAWFPPLYLVGAGCLGLAAGASWLVRKPPRFLAPLQLMLLLCVLYVLPLVLRFSPLSFIGAYDNFAFTDYIMRHGHFDVTKLYYLNWPGAWIVGVALTRITGFTDPVPILRIAPAVFALMITPVLYAFLGRALGRFHSHLIWPALWLFHVGNWVGQLTLTAQSFGYLWIWMLLSLWLVRRADSVSSELPQRLIALLVFGALIVTHLLSALIVLAVSVVLMLRGQAIRRTTSALLGIGIAVWLLYVSTQFFNSNFAAVLHSAFRLDQLLSLGVGQRFAGNPTHRFINAMRLGFSMAFLVLAALGFLAGRKRRRADLLICAILLAIEAPCIALGGGYGFELAYRVFFFALPILAYFACRVLEARRGARLLLMLAPLLLVGSLMAYYGNQPLQELSTSMQVGFGFFKSKAGSGFLVSDFPPPTFGTNMIYDRENYIAIPSSEALAPGGLDHQGPGEVFFPISALDRTFYSFDLNATLEPVQQAVEANPRYIRFFTDGDLDLYVWPRDAGR